MANLAAKISEEELEVFLERISLTDENWWYVQHFANANDRSPKRWTGDFDSVLELVSENRSANSFDREEDFIYILGSEFDLESAASWERSEKIEEVDSDELERFIISAPNVRSPFLCFCIDNESFDSGSYFTLSHEVFEPRKQIGINRIRIENFKGIRDPVSIALKPITLFFGSNSAGKSTVIHALHYAREILANRNLDPKESESGGRYVDFGGFKNLVHGKNIREHRSVRLKLECDLNDGDDLSFFDSDFQAVHEFFEKTTWTLVKGTRSVGVEVEVSWDPFEGQAYVSKTEIFYNGKRLCSLTCSSPGKNAVLEEIDFEHPCLLTLGDLYGRSSESGSQKALFDLEEVEQLEINFTDEEMRESLLDKLMQHCGSQLEPADGKRLTLIKVQDALPPLDKRLNFDSMELEVLYSKDEERERDKTSRLIGALQNILSDIVLVPIQIVAEHLEAFRYLGPIRDVPDRDYRAKMPKQSESETSKWATGIAAWDRLCLGPDKLVDEVSSWMSKEGRLSTGYRLDRRTFFVVDSSSSIGKYVTSGVDELDEWDPRILAGVDSFKQIYIVPADMPEEAADNLTLAPCEVGVGISQLVPVVVLSCDGNDKMIAMEQPELHVHPKVQASIADLIIDGWQERGNQFLLETHSIHLTLRLLRRIRNSNKKEEDGHPREPQADDTMQTRLSHEDVCFYYVDNEEGWTDIQHVGIDSEGKFLHPWPDDFFQLDRIEKYGD